MSTIIKTPKYISTEEFEKLCNEFCGNEMKVVKNIAEKIFTRFGGISLANYDDYYSMANYTVYQALLVYDPSKNNNPRAYLTGCIQNRLRDQLRNDRRDKNCHKIVIVNDNGEEEIEFIPTISFDAPLDLSGDVSDSIGDIFVTNNSVEDEYFKDEVEDTDLFNNKAFTRLQRKIMKQLVDGYSRDEIKKNLKINNNEYNDAIEAIKSKMKFAR